MRTATANAPSAPEALSPDVEQGLARNAIAFPDGIPGFETCRRFVLLTSDAIAPLQRLESLEGPAAAFVGIDPRLVYPEYECALSDGDLRSLDAAAQTTLLWFAIITCGPDGTLVANLRAPIAINPERMLGRQVLNDDKYPLRHVLAKA